MAEQITARIARAFRAAADAAKTHSNVAYGLFTVHAGELEQYPPHIVKDIVAVLLRELSPEPPDDLVDAMAQRLVGKVVARVADLEADRLRAEVESLRAELATARDRDTAAQAVVSDVRAALEGAPRTCRFHGGVLEWAGMQWGEPRCESCRQPWRVVQALRALDGLVRRARDPARDYERQEHTHTCGCEGTTC